MHERLGTERPIIQAPMPARKRARSPSRCRTLHRASGRADARAEASGGELPLRAAGRATARRGAAERRDDPLLRDHGGRSAVARVAWRGRDHRAGVRGGRASGDVSLGGGVAAAIALGAAAVQVGTSYLLCPEATTSAVHRSALSSAAAHHTALTNIFSGRPARGILNRLMRELLCGVGGRDHARVGLGAPRAESLRAVNVSAQFER